jgi:hypothetical protein
LDLHRFGGAEEQACGGGDAVPLLEFRNVRAPGRRTIPLACVPTPFEQAEDLYLAISWPSSDGVRGYGDGAALPATRRAGSSGSYLAVGSDGELQELRDLDLAVRLLFEHQPKAETSDDQSTPPVEAFLRSTPSGGGLQIHFGVARPGQIALMMYDVMGRLVRRLHDGELEAGLHTKSWDGRDDRGQRVAAGVYLARLQTTHGVLTHKGILLR